MNNGLFYALIISGISLGSMHTLAPDHWVPFAAVARARNWSTWRTVRLTILCGFGHVTASVALGLVGLFAGVEMIQAFGHRIEAVAGILLIAFGIIYAIWGLRRKAGEHLHGHSHANYDHVHDPSKVSAWSLFLLFSADPCVAVIPLLFAAAPLGAMRTTGVVATYEIATIATMVGLVIPARAGAKLLRFHWVEHYGDVAAGALIALVGIVVASLGW
ncbi:MAG TPA: hypothetical protein VKA53_02655 [Thermoanaerobaculia bacterium]|nr:hypothetical protein [Thermoanaerobaculia bacterium]